MLTIRVEDILQAIPQPAALMNGYGEIFYQNTALVRLLPRDSTDQQLSELVLENTTFGMEKWLHIAASTRCTVPITLQLKNDLMTKYRVEATLVTPSTLRSSIILLARFIPFEQKARKYAALNRKVVNLEHEISHLKLAGKELMDTASRDALTHLLNRRGFYNALGEKLERSRYAETLQKSYSALFMVDIDHFKVINDTHGHQIGDGVLMAISQRLTKLTQAEDLVVRYGGEEFLIYTSADAFTDFHQLARRIHTYFCDHKILVKDLALEVTVSIGIRIFTPLELKAINIDALLEQSDQAMYKSKKLGRNRICIYNSDATQGADLLT